MKSRGFTLVEVLIASAIGTLVVLLVMTMFYSNIRNYVGLTERMDSEDTFLRVESILKRMGRQAVNVQQYDETKPQANQPEGWIRAFNDTDPAHPIPTSAADSVFQWGLFQREAATAPTGVPPVSTISLTGLFYIPPTVDASGAEYQGAIFIDPDSAGTGQVMPSYYGTASTNASFYVGHISNVMVQNTTIVTAPVNGTSPTTNRILSADVQITVRYFEVNTPMANRCYRPIALCKAASHLLMGHDVTRTFSILFRNNDFGPNQANSAIEQRGLESIYFFQDYGGGNYQ